MKLKILYTLVLLICPLGKVNAQFSTDGPILIKILANNISQLYKLYSIVRNTQQNLYLMREMYSGMHHAIHHMNEIGPEHFTPLVYGHWKNGKRALSELQQIYGFAAPSKNSRIERDTDKTIAGGVALANQVAEASSVAKRIGKKISRRSNSSSPKGAARLTAQGVGALVETSGQSLRTQGEGVKLQAQALAIQNRKDKEETKHRLKSAKTLQKELKKRRKNFRTPRFKNE